MTTNDFTLKHSTVAAVYATDHGTEIWGAYDDGTEAACTVNDGSFRAREGHKLTVICCGLHPVAVRNDTTRTKVQLLTGEDLLGTGPQVRPRSGSFWLGWAFFICCPGILISAIPGAIFNIGDNLILKYIGGILSLACYLSFIFGIPFWFIIRPRILRHKHQRRIKAADKAIAEIFNPL